MKLSEYLESHQKKHLIFDVDCTIFRLMLPWERWEENISEKLLSLDKAILQDYLESKISLNKLQNLYILKYGQVAKSIFNKNNVEFESKLLEGVVPNQELVDFILKNSKYNLYVWTSNTTNVIHKILSDFNIKSKFSKIVTSEDVLYLKPNPDGFDSIYEKDEPKSSYLIIGDSETDKQAAEDIGVDFYYVDYFKK